MGGEMVLVRYVRIALYAILATVLQSTVFSHLSVQGVRPDLVLIMVVVFGLLGGWKLGVIVAVIGGIIEGLLAEQFLGIRVVSFLISGLLAGAISSKVNTDSILTLVMTVLFATVIHSMTGIFFVLAEGVRISARYICLNMVLPKVVYNIVVSVVLKWWLRWLFGTLVPLDIGELQIE
jgi:rod shape-determining protein MreD